MYGTFNRVYRVVLEGRYIGYNILILRDPFEKTSTIVVISETDKTDRST